MEIVLMKNKQQAQAEVAKVKQISTIWIVPIIALLIAAWMIYQYASKSGPEITLIMSDASGIEVGKTEIKSRSVKVGVVTDVKLSKNYDHIIAKASIDNDARRMLKEDTLFWVAKPRVGREGISGLETILSGPYIEIQAGAAEKEQREFTVLEVPPVAPPDAKGLRVLLTHPQAGRLNVGDPVIYQGFTAGRVEKVGFDGQLQQAFYQAFIFQPYDKLIRTGSHFWINSGVDLELNSEGVKVRFASLESLLGGGVSFAVPDGESDGELISEQFSQFTLFNDQQEIKEGLYSQHIEWVMLFDESLRGLNPGAPVEFRGLRIGSVEKVPFSKPSIKDGFRATRLPVLIRIDSHRVFAKDQSIANADFKEVLIEEFKRGLRGSLKTGSLLTGALYIDIDYDKNAPAYQQQSFAGYDIFPSVQGELAQVQKQVMEIIEKFNNLPLNDTITSMNNALQTLQKTLTSADHALLSVDKLLAQEQMQSLPAELQASLIKMQQTLDGFSPHATVYQNLNAALLEFEKMMSEFQPLLEQLNKKPNSLLFGKEPSADPVPVKGDK